MPLYVYKCPTCGREMHDMRSIAERQDTPLCGNCKTMTVLQIGAVAGFVRDPAVPRRAK